MSSSLRSFVVRAAVVRRGGGDVEPHRDISFSCQHRARERTEERLFTLLRCIATGDGRTDTGITSERRPPREREGREGERRERRSFVFRSLNRLRFLSGGHTKQFGRNKSQKTERPNDRSIDRKE